MPTFVSLSKPSRFPLYAKPVWAAETVQYVLKSKWGIQVEPGPDFTLTLTSGKDSGQDVTELAATQRASAFLCSVNPNKYQVLVVTNPALQQSCIVQAPQLVEPGERVDVTLQLTAHKALKLEDIQWLARLYLLE